jgi:hypothetical protein
MQSIISAVTPSALSMQAKYSFVISLSAAASAGVLNTSPKKISMSMISRPPSCGTSRRALRTCDLMSLR